MFLNYLNQTAEDECAEQRNGRWFIKLGFAGFNTRANNRNGYDTRDEAEKACLRSQSPAGTYAKAVGVWRKWRDLHP